MLCTSLWSWSMSSEMRSRLFWLAATAASVSVAAGGAAAGAATVSSGADCSAPIAAGSDGAETSKQLLFGPKVVFGPHLFF